MGNVQTFVKVFELTSIPLNFAEEWNISILQEIGITGYQLYPHKVKGEGILFSVVQKHSSEEEVQRRFRKNNTAFTIIPSWLENHLDQPDKLRIRKETVSNSFIHVDAEEKANDFLMKFPRAELLAE